MRATIEKIGYLLWLLMHFTVTGLIGSAELTVWILFKDALTPLMNIENDVWGVKYAVIFAFVVVPLVSAIIEYKSNKKKIKEIVKNIID